MSQADLGNLWVLEVQETLYLAAQQHLFLLAGQVSPEAQDSLCHLGVQGNQVVQEGHLPQEVQGVVQFVLLHLLFLEDLVNLEFQQNLSLLCHQVTLQCLPQESQVNLFHHVLQGIQVVQGDHVLLSSQLYPMLLLDLEDLAIRLFLVFLLFQEYLVVLGNQDLPSHLSGWNHK